MKTGEDDAFLVYVPLLLLAALLLAGARETLARSRNTLITSPQ
ncbi:MAG: hypothetical protein ACRDF1_08355 [bacterium]